MVQRTLLNYSTRKEQPFSQAKSPPSRLSPYGISNGRKSCFPVSRGPVGMESCRAPSTFGTTPPIQFDAYPPRVSNGLTCGVWWQSPSAQRARGTATPLWISRSQPDTLPNLSGTATVEQGSDLKFLLERSFRSKRRLRRERLHEPGR